MKLSFKSTTLAALGATLALSLVTPAQQVTPNNSTPQAQEQRGGRFDKRMKRGKFRRAKTGKIFKQLNLTDAQKEQMRSFAAQTKEATRTQRAELFRLREQRQPGVALSAEAKARRQQLRAELRQSREASRAQMLTILTPEQRAQMEQLKQQRQQRRATRRARTAGQQSR